MPAGAGIGILDASNIRLNVGVTIGFGSATLVAYAILNWSTALLTSKGVSLSLASYAMSAAGVAAIAGSARYSPADSAACCSIWGMAARSSSSPCSPLPRR